MPKHEQMPKTLRGLKRLALKYCPLPHKDVAWFVHIRLSTDHPTWPMADITYYAKEVDDSDRGYNLGMEIMSICVAVHADGTVDRRGITVRDYVKKLMPHYTIVLPKSFKGDLS